MACMCGDTHCRSCGPAQGNNRCSVCGNCDDDGGCSNPVICAAKEVEQQKMEDAIAQSIVDEQDEADRLISELPYTPEWQFLRRG